MHPSGLAPAYWINMGAVAIFTLAGSLLVLAAPNSPVVLKMLPFVKGLTFARCAEEPIGGACAIGR